MTGSAAKIFTKFPQKACLKPHEAIISLFRNVKRFHRKWTKFLWKPLLNLVKVFDNLIRCSITSFPERANELVSHCTQRTHVLRMWIFVIRMSFRIARYTHYAHIQRAIFNHLNIFSLSPRKKPGSWSSTPSLLPLNKILMWQTLL